VSDPSSAGGVVDIVAVGPQAHASIWPRSPYIPGSGATEGETMPIADLAATLRLIKYQFRTGRLEQAFTTLMLLSFGAGAALGGTKESWPNFLGLNLSLFARYGSSVAYALGALFALLLAYRIWKQAIVVEEPPPPPPSAAIKGLLPFTEDDGKLFARLGRSIELQRLLAITQSDQIGVCALFIGRQFQQQRRRPCSTPSGPASLT
jgi:hypothetical protein